VQHKIEGERLPIASVRVNFKPLSEIGTAIAGAAIGLVQQQLHERANTAAGSRWRCMATHRPIVLRPKLYRFDFRVDPPDDETLFTGLRNGTSTAFLPIPTITELGPPPASVPRHRSHRWDEYYNRWHLHRPCVRCIRVIHDQRTRRQFALRELHR
jgi:hypothetical protein